MDIIGLLFLLALAIIIKEMKKIYTKNYFEIYLYVQHFTFNLHIFHWKLHFYVQLQQNLKKKQ